jgi:glycine/D-amino acid oxidase-like deaminating enzyme
MVPLWFQLLTPEEHALLRASDPAPRTADVLILGAGNIGLATAYYLIQAGVTGICILDPVGPLAGASGANAGGLWFSQQSPELGPLVPLAHASSRLYDQLDSSIQLRRSGLIELLTGPTDPVADVHRAGFRAELLAPDEIRKNEPKLAEAPHGAVYYPDDGQVNPVRLGLAFLRRLREKNTEICTNEPNLRPPQAGVTVITSGAWTPEVTRALGWTPPIKPLRGQLLATPPVGPTLRHTVLGPSFYYWQLAEGHVAGGGTVEDIGFTAGTNPADLAAIRTEMNRLFPSLASVPTACAWSGFRPYCQDLKPVIGRVPGHDRVYVAAGHFKKGIMLAPVTGKILADLITTGRTDLPIAPFDPARFV